MKREARGSHTLLLLLLQKCARLHLVRKNRVIFSESASMATAGVSFTTGSAAPKHFRSERRSKPMQWVESMSRSGYRWLEEYLLEWQRTDARNMRKLLSRTDALTQAVNYSDVVCFVKPGGLCPFCNLASRILVDASSSKDQPPFSLRASACLDPPPYVMSHRCYPPCLLTQDFLLTQASMRFPPQTLPTCSARTARRCA